MNQRSNVMQDILTDLRIDQLNSNSIKDAWEIIKADAKWLNEQGLDHWITYYSEDLMREKLKHGNVFCLYNDNKPVATVSLVEDNPSYYPKEDLKKFTKVDSCLYITALAVHPNEHGKGYAKQLLKFCEYYAKENNVDSLRFDARASYKELIDFYIKRGYTKVGVMDDEGEDYILFEKLIEFKRSS